MTSKTPSFSSLVMVEFGTVPPQGLLYIAIASAASAASDMLRWTHRPDLLPVDFGISVVLIGGWVIAIYAVSMLMAGGRFSIIGLGKFVATSIATALPLILSVGLYVVAARARSGEGMAGAVVLILGSLAIFALLPGWPILQAMTATAISPLKALRSTGGFRLPLVLAALVAGAINGAVPALSTAEDLGTACLLAVVGAVAAAASTLVGLSIAVAAWRLMSGDQRSGVS